ncbi:MAG: DUF424 family protein [Nanoarchaeota archaeon]|nr:DUF424 family protein [Nanoarchaeota archaeon]MBU1849736.1 DUF424 family protein [Nanoarchaeota archaeon]
MKEFIVKKHEYEGKVVLAICDKELLGKKIVEEKKQLDITLKFYKGTEKNDLELKELIKKNILINAVGKKIIALLINEEIISEKEIKFVKGIPHIQIILL